MQAILPRRRAGEFLRLCLATARGELADFQLDVDPRPNCAVVLAAAGYPEHVTPGAAIEIDPELTTPQRCFLHAGTALSEGVLRVSGGRVGAVVAHGETVSSARKHAYQGLCHIRYAGRQHRNDIGT